MQPFTRARIDEQLFGEHTGITLPGPLIGSPMPYCNAALRTSEKGNPYYMAPGWKSHHRHIDVAYRAAGAGSVPKLGINIWDRQYGIIGTPPPNLEVIRANQMGTMSFV